MFMSAILRLSMGKRRCLPTIISCINPCKLPSTHQSTQSAVAQNKVAEEKPPYKHAPGADGKQGWRGMLWIGLGNPGKSSKGTRHNLGFMVLDAFAADHNLTWRHDRNLRASVTSFVSDTGITVHMMKPITYMNCSGQALRAFFNHMHKTVGIKIQPKQVLVLSDDMDLILGQIRVKPKGSSGGHNGLRSIEQALGTQDYLRLRMGIGQPQFTAHKAGSNKIDFVLSTFRPCEKDRLHKVITNACTALSLLAEETNYDEWMSTVNAKKGKYQCVD
eukprot:gene2412-5354_t